MTGRCLADTPLFLTGRSLADTPPSAAGAAAARRRLVVHMDPVKRAFEALALEPARPLPPPPSPGCTSLCFVDGRLYSAGAAVAMPSSKLPQLPHQPRCWRPLSQGHGVLSADAWFVTGPLRPLIEWACEVGLHPNAVTLSSMVVTLAMLLLPRASRVALWAVPLMMMYKWLADVVDGPIARRCDKSSRLGAALDTAADLMFIAVGYVLLTECVLPARKLGRRSLRLWAEAVAVAAAPLLLQLASSADAVVDHGSFKDFSNPVNATMWVLSENSFVLIATVAVVYVVFSLETMRAQKR
jgi:phosphatidylserine synthase